MTDLAPVLQGFFTDRLARQKKASPNTVAAYRDTFRLLIQQCASWRTHGLQDSRGDPADGHPSQVR